MARKVSPSKAERKGVFLDRVSITGMVEGKWAWALGVYSRTEGITISEALETAVRGLLEGTGIQWTKYERKREAILGRTRSTGSGETLVSGENPSPLVPGDSGEPEVTLPPALASETAGEGGGPALGEKAGAKAERAKKLAREIGAKQRRAG